MTDLQLNDIFNHLLTDIVEIDIRSIRLGYSREASHDYLFFFFVALTVKHFAVLFQ